MQTISRLPAAMTDLRNDQIAHDLERIAELLEDQGANPYRVRAYRLAAARLRGLDQPVYDIWPTRG